MSLAKLRLPRAPTVQNETDVGDLRYELCLNRQTLYRHVDLPSALSPNEGKLLWCAARGQSRESKPRQVSV